MLALAWFLGGGVFGVLVVRFLLFSAVDVAMWNRLLDLASSGELGLNAIDASTVVMKCAIGFFVGGVLLGLVGVSITRSRKRKKRQQGDEQDGSSP